jgi:RHS repeat-associated protein
LGIDLTTTVDSSCASARRYTGKERDTESGLDNFGARFDASTLGRFMTPDWAAKPTTVPYANFGNPQSLNLYSYVKNNPTTFGDPDGHEVDLTGTDEDKRKEEQRIAANASKKGEAALFKTQTKNGKTKLVLDKDAAANFKGKHSKGFNMLVQAIDAKATATVVMWDHDSGTDLQPNGNSTVKLDRNVSGVDEHNPMHDGSGRVIPNPFKIIAGHELLGHARLNMLGDPAAPDDGPGSKTFKIENQLRGEQGLAPRPDNEP